MFFSSVVMYLFIRRGQRQQIPLNEYLLSMFILPLIVYFFVLLYTKTSLVIPFWQIGLIAGISFVFSYIGNVLSQKSILLASNPGYSLSITKAYVIFTTLFAVFFFHSVLTLKAVIAIALIVVFSALISINPSSKKQTRSSMVWLPLAIGAFFCFAGLALFSTYILKLGVNVYVWLFYLFFFVSLFIGLGMMLQKTKVQFSGKTFPTLFMIGVMSMVFNLYTQLGYKEAPNPGYINAANAASITLVTLLSALFFKDELTLRKIIGVIGVSVGLILLFI